MTTTHTYRGIVWIDLESPDENEISSLVKRYDLHPLVGEELKSSSSLAKIDVYKDYTFIVLTLPIRTRQGDSYVVVDREVDFVIGKHFLITSRFEAIEQLEYFAKIFEANEILGKNTEKNALSEQAGKIEHAGHIFYYMIKRLYAGMQNDLENIRDAVVAAENRIFRGGEKHMVKHLSNLNRELIDFKQTARIHQDIWMHLGERSERSIFGPDFGPYIEDLKSDFNHIHELIINARELLSDLRETNDLLLNTKQNEIIKDLTLIAFIFYPLTTIAAIFTIPGVDVPLVENPHGWWLIMTVMVILSIGIWFFFKKKKWM
jgi:magnesium transporter